MNIQEAKQEIVNTVRAYTARDETGALRIPVEKQRPLLVIGPPGIGKTAIMEQAAQELGINLVSYTITHHTRQSAIGLPFISKREYGGREYSVTEYTMSEIIASVYEQIERSGVEEGILFLDEINCVSETLAPTMLQFLQYKTFGTHRIPDGFVIVTAGNPPQYNKSVRDFDIVTLDRVKKIEVTEDLDVWKEYAYKMGVDGAIMAYLDIRKENFYSIRTAVDDRYFVTARGWEDLSSMISVYEGLGIPITQNLIVQYLQDPEIARDFADYYELYRKYRTVYQVPQILEGNAPEKASAVKNSPFDEKLSLISLLIDALQGEFRAYAADLDVQKALLEELSALRTSLKEGNGSAKDLLKDMIRDKTNALSHRKEAHMVSRDEEKAARLLILALEELLQKVTVEGRQDAREDFLLAKGWFDQREAERQKRAQATGDHLTHSFEFMARTFGEGQEMVIFLSELTAGFYSLRFVKECGNDAYYRYNMLLLLNDRREELRDEILSLQGMV